MRLEEIAEHIESTSHQAAVLEAAPKVLTLSRMSVAQLRQGSILAFEFLSSTVVKQPPCTTVLPATPPTFAVLVICPALYESPALFACCSS